ncbi:MAG: ABC transporter ATP-binding protein [Deltaproteobacteria bacterium]|nr:ABC transporter ATP-binding protein [Deltaproteobacteria bacterium]
MSLLDIRGVSVHFGGVHALEEVSLNLNDGELLGLIGPNGAGKTTMLRVITGVVRASRGTVQLEGKLLNVLPTHLRVRKGLGFAQQLVRPFQEMTLVENVAFAVGSEHTRHPWRSLLRVERKAALREGREWLAKVGIDGAADSLPTAVPLGFLKRLEVARALAIRPRMLLLDEPLAGLNQAEATAFADILVELNHQGQTILLIEHNLAEVRRICSRLVVLDNGRKLDEGSPEVVLTNPAVQEAYIGQGTVYADN